MGSKNHPNYKLFPVANLRHQLSSYSQIILIYFPSDALQFLGKLTPLIKVCWPCWFLHHTGVFPLRDLRGGSGVTDVKWTFFPGSREEVERLWKIDLEIYIALEISDIRMTRAHMLYDNRPLESIPVTPIRWEKRWEPEELFRWQRFVWFKDCNIPRTQRHIMHSMALFQWLFGCTHNNFPFCLSVKGLAAL